jgi:hypothetical protein
MNIVIVIIGDIDVIAIGVFAKIKNDNVFIFKELQGLYI